MRFTPEPVPDSRLPRLAPRARRAGGILDGGCVCIPHISSLFYLLFSPLHCARLETYAERLSKKGSLSSLSLSFIVRLTDTLVLP